MSRFILPALISLSIIARALGQSPSPQNSPAGPTPTPAPAPPTAPKTNELIDSLNAADLQEAVSLLKKNFTNPDAINDTQISRATLEGLMARLGPGLMLLPDKISAAPDIAAPFYSEIIEKHVGYLRLGTLNPANLDAMDKKLAEFAPKKVDALVVDLRASSGADFDNAAQFAKRFTAKSKTLFSLRKQGKDRAFTSDRDPVYQGLIVLLVDSETAGSAEAFASALRFLDKAMLIGETTAARAVEYSDLPLPSGKILRVAVSEVIGPDGKSLYPTGLKPDLPVEMSLVDKRQIFQNSASKGMSPSIYESERPHLNEAALLAGTNPELETADQRRGRTQDRIGPKDPMLQRALDLVTSLEVYQKR